MEKKLNTPKKNNQKKVGNKRRPSLYSIAILLGILVVIVVTICCIGKSLYISLKYKKYTDKMEEYGFDLLYKNEKANSGQSVTRSELVKVVLGSIMNENDISDNITLENPTYDNEGWVTYAQQVGIIEKGNITAENEGNKATYKQAENIVVNAVKVLLNKDIVSDDIYSNILKYKSKNRKYNKLIKGELNKLVITVVDYYSVIYYNAYKDSDVKIVTDKDKLPSNYNDYPYIIDSIDNEIYEIPFIVENEEKFETPKQEYVKRKGVYSQIEEVITNYFDAVLNVNYETITNESLFNSIKNSLYYDSDSSMVNEYVKYVKKYKIKLEGKSTVLLPIMYNTGEGIRVRVKIEFRMVNSNTDINLLLPDVLSRQNVHYTDFEHKFYCDIPMGIILDAMSLRVNTPSLINCVVSDNPTMEKIEGEE